MLWAFALCNCLWLLLRAIAQGFCPNGQLHGGFAGTIDGLELYSQASQITASSFARTRVVSRGLVGNIAWIKWISKHGRFAQADFQGSQIDSFPCFPRQTSRTSFRGGQTVQRSSERLPPRSFPFGASPSQGCVRNMSS